MTNPSLTKKCGRPETPSLYPYLQKWDYACNALAVFVTVKHIDIKINEDK